MPEREIGMGRTARTAYELADIAIVPSRRTRSSSDISIAWQIDAYRFDVPLVTQPTDAVVSPAVAAAVSGIGGLGVLDGEGLWARHADPQKVIDELLERAAAADDPDDIIAEIQRIYAEPVSVDLLTEAIRTLRESGGTVSIRLSPQNAASLAGPAIAAGVALLVLQGTISSAEHVQANGAALNLKSFIADLDVPVIVGGCSDYKTATHLMRTGAAGVIVGTGHGNTTTTDEVLGIAAGGIQASADIATAIACGAAAVMLGEPLTWATEAPAAGWYWPTTAAHPVLPRGFAAPVGPGDVPLEQLLLGPALGADGRTNLFGALRRAMAKAGYSDLKEFQKVGLTIRA